MRRVRAWQEGRATLDLIEEAFHLLRGAPAGALLAYAMGTLPFLLGLLVFWSDMSRSASASQRLEMSALGLALLFVWMKAGHAVFAQGLLNQLTGVPAPHWTSGRWWRAMVYQTVVQPSGLLILPVALVLLVPFAWAYAFYQNATVLVTGESGGVRKLIQQSWQQARLWPGQNHLALLVFKMFGLFVFLNLITMFFTVPTLLKSLLGVETAFSRLMQDPEAATRLIFNSTFLTAAASLTFLCVDPMLKAFYVLRCFYGQSLRTGQDLQSELKGHANARRPVAVVLAAVALTLAVPVPGSAFQIQGSTEALSKLHWRSGELAFAAIISPGNRKFAANTSSPLRDVESGSEFPDAGTGMPAADSAGGTLNLEPRTSNLELGTKRAPSNAVNPAELEYTMQRVISRREYEWRLPVDRSRPETEETSALARLVQNVMETLRGWAESFFRWLGKALRWIFPPPPPVPSARVPWSLWSERLRWLLALLTVGLAAVLGVLVYRMWQRRRPREDDTPVSAAPPMLDLTDDSLGAEQLPEDGWTTLARELIAQGDLRLALRAFYLASLAHLAERSLITLAKFKSNREYERELARHSHALPDLAVTFSENVSAFDRVWYGRHEVSRERLDQFARNVDLIRGSTFTPIPRLKNSEASFLHPPSCL